jgi:hypothetical protein
MLKSLIQQNHTIISAIIKTRIEFQFREAICDAMSEEMRRDETFDYRK